MNTLKRIEVVMNIVLCLIRKWWRPITCIGIAGSVLVHGVILPLMIKQSPDLTGLAALITSAAAAFAVREWGKSKGTVE
jgi:uncharacterized membrane protein YagU involved in acid resistance